MAAASAGVDYAVIVGKDELDAWRLTLRDMSGEAQEGLLSKAARAICAHNSFRWGHAVDTIISTKKARITERRMIRS